MTGSKRRRLDRSGRAKLRSPGRPPVGRREDRQRFWAAIAAGCSSEAAAADARVSPVVGVRWFRESGGMPPSHLTLSYPPLSGRYLSFSEREQIALFRVQRHGVREIARRLGRATPGCVQCSMPTNRVEGLSKGSRKTLITMVAGQ